MKITYTYRHNHACLYAKQDVVLTTEVEGDHFTPPTAPRCGDKYLDGSLALVDVSVGHEASVELTNSSEEEPAEQSV